jgi:peptidoglycan/xylan/chitin deacetylase (PgdA/CDA1 family)
VKKSAKHKKLSLVPKELNVFSQHFLITVVCMVLAIIVVGQVFSGSGQPAHDDQGKNKNYPKSHRAKPPTPSSLPISVWHGPVTPMAIAPGLPPVIDRVPVTVPVVFVTIDDGWVQTPENLNWLSSHRLPFSMFLSDAGIRTNYQYFQTLQAAGMSVQNHTISHPRLPKMNADQQRAEICGASDVYQNVFKHRPTLFRPPYGEYSDVTRQIVADCGMRALVMWKATLEGGAMHFQTPNATLVPGDIILAHFEPDLVPNMDALARQLDQDHLQVGQLEDWIK